MPSLTENALAVLNKRYLRTKADGTKENPEELFRRVAKAIAAGDLLNNENAKIDKMEQEFYNLISSLDFIPNSPTLLNAGTDIGMLSACFVLPLEDNMDSIFSTLKDAVKIQKAGGGTGFNFSKIRHKGATVRNTADVAAGPVIFLKIYSAALKAVRQGLARGGANMGIMNCDHPDILEFIHCKEKENEITNFNISVGITDAFMEAVESGKGWDLTDPHDGKIVKTIPAHELFNEIIEGAWKNGEPGAIFLDIVNKYNPTPALGQMIATNPCGELPLLPYESCNLGSINISNHFSNGVDWDKLRKTIWSAVHFLDNIISVSKHPLPSVEDMTKTTRKIGLGVMGFADLLFKMGIPYNSEAAVLTGEQIMQFVQTEAKKASIVLAEERGSFPAFRASIYSGGPSIRNSTVTTIAPTGTISIIAGCSSGIEPTFALAFKRNVLDGETLYEVNPVFEEKLKAAGLWSPELLKEMVKTGSCPANLPDELKKTFVISAQISVEWHVKMQSAFQRWCDNSVSKTINFSFTATKEDVAAAYIQAWKTGCKGITVYRSGSRDAEVLQVENKAVCVECADHACPVPVESKQ
ncbi:MAG: adenosylcobalamin-dependent ribonucleoside-diphosphate reductase [Candidatus Aenigmarchaeota archaeon]|nr:adenosylcobalamin-dependent ribonucleoside-diphosphate reductase [Candidatus Aenigmarchaeota archaeon]